MPIPLCIHVLLFLMFLELLCIPHSRFDSFLHFFPWLGSRFGNAHWLRSFLNVFAVVSSLPGWENPFFFVAQRMVEETHDFWVFAKIILAM